MGGTPLAYDLNGNLTGDGIHQTTVSEHIRRALAKLRRVLRAGSPDAPMAAISLYRGWDT